MRALKRDNSEDHNHNNIQKENNSIINGSFMGASNSPSKKMMNMTMMINKTVKEDTLPRNSLIGS